MRLSGGVNERWPGDKGAFDRGPTRRGQRLAAIVDHPADFQSIHGQPYRAHEGFPPVQKSGACSFETSLLLGSPRDVAIEDRVPSTIVHGPGVPRFCNSIGRLLWPLAYASLGVRTNGATDALSTRGNGRVVCVKRKRKGRLNY